MSRLPNLAMPILIVALDGHGGSGKSTLADVLAKRLDAQIIHTDDFASWENPVNWWPLLIEHTLEPITQGATLLNYPRSKWWADHIPTPVAGQPVTSVMILEGVTALRTAFRPYIGYGIFVDTPVELCLQRGLARDRGMDGKSDEEILAMWRDWIAAEDRYIESENPRGSADAVVAGDQPLAPQLDALEFAIKERQMTLMARKERGATKSRSHHV